MKRKRKTLEKNHSSNTQVSLSTEPSKVTLQYAQSGTAQTQQSIAVPSCGDTVGDDQIDLGSQVSCWGHRVIVLLEDLLSPKPPPQKKVFWGNEPKAWHLSITGQ